MFWSKMLSFKYNEAFLYTSNIFIENLIFLQAGSCNILHYNIIWHDNTRIRVQIIARGICIYVLILKVRLTIWVIFLMTLMKEYRSEYWIKGVLFKWIVFKQIIIIAFVILITWTIITLFSLIQTAVFAGIDVKPFIK